MTREEENMLSRNLSNNQIQDILDDLGMIDDNGCCPYTAEEIFKAGVNYADSHPREGLWDAKKVISFLTKHATVENSSNINIHINGATYHFVSDFIKDLHKAMEN